MNRKERKCIAVLITKPERKYQDGLLKGICESTFSHGMNVAVFAASLMAGYEGYLWGEQEIFNLPDYEKFSGIIYAIGSFDDEQLKERLVERVRQAAQKGVPVVVVDGKAEGLPCYLNDDANAVEDLIRHLVLEHGVRDIAYMTGHKGHFHAENSLQAYEAAMKRLQLPIFDNRTFYGDYWYDEAENFVNYITASSKGLPQAIVCANEHMAISVYRELNKRGIYVPKDILLGCTANDASTAPYLLTAENTLENVGMEAGEKIWRVLHGEALGEETRFFPCKNRLITGVGCGCQKISEYDYSKERGVLVDIDPGYFGEFNFGRERILSAQDYPSLFKAFDFNTSYLPGLHNISMCMCDGWDSPEFLIRDTRCNPYTKRMQLYYCREERPGEEASVYIGEDRYFDIDEVYPGLFEEKGEPSEYVFRGIHFLDRNFGYIVLNNGSATRVYDYTFNFWLHDISNGLESQCRLQSVNYMYSTDIMTGLYNRNGFNRMFSMLQEEAEKQGKQVLIVMADMNCLKLVNDTYGHEAGDGLIQAGASLLKQQRVPGAVLERSFRIGGDEFVKIAIGEFTEKLVTQFERDLYESIDGFSTGWGKPYRVEMGVGCCFGAATSLEAMEGIMAEADQRMYVRKNELKKAHQ